MKPLIDTGELRSCFVWIPVGFDLKAAFQREKARRQRAMRRRRR